jgi:hypothetical protein
MFVVVVVSLSLVPLPLSACTFRYSLTGSDGKAAALSPGRDAPLSAGKTYTLSVTFEPDHRNCATPVDATAYFLEGEAWKTAKDGAAAGGDSPLILLSLGAWMRETPQRYTQALTFTAGVEGRFDLEVVRDCPKGGYDDYLTFVVK